MSNRLYVAVQNKGEIIFVESLQHIYNVSIPAKLKYFLSAKQVKVS